MVLVVLVVGGVGRFVGVNLSSNYPYLTTCRSNKEAAGPLARTGAFYVPVERTEAVQAAREGLPIFGEEQRIMEAVRITYMCLYVYIYMYMYLC